MNRLTIIELKTISKFILISVNMFGFRGLTYTLRGSEGWSTCQHQTIEINKVLDISGCKRDFSIFQRKYPYTLHIQYDQPQSRVRILPVIGSGLGFFTCSFYTNQTSVITKRYMSKDILDEDIKNIKLMKEKTEEYYNKISKEFMKEMGLVIPPNNKPKD